MDSKRRVGYDQCRIYPYLLEIWDMNIFNPDGEIRVHGIFLFLQKIIYDCHDGGKSIVHREMEPKRVTILRQNL